MKTKYLAALVIFCLSLMMESSTAFTWEKWGEGKKWGRSFEEHDKDLDLDASISITPRHKWNIEKREGYKFFLHSFNE